MAGSGVREILAPICKSPLNGGDVSSGLWSRPRYEKREVEEEEERRKKWRREGWLFLLGARGAGEGMGSSGR